MVAAGVEFGLLKANSDATPDMPADDALPVPAALAPAPCPAAPPPNALPNMEYGLDEPPAPCPPPWNPVASWPIVGTGGTGGGGGLFGRPNGFRDPVICDVRAFAGSCAFVIGVDAGLAKGGMILLPSALLPAAGAKGDCDGLLVLFPNGPSANPVC